MKLNKRRSIINKSEILSACFTAGTASYATNRSHEKVVRLVYTDEKSSALTNYFVYYELLCECYLFVLARLVGFFL